MSAVSGELRLDIGAFTEAIQEALGALQRFGENVTQRGEGIGESLFGGVHQGSKEMNQALTTAGASAQSTLHGVAASAQAASTAVSQTGGSAGRAAGGFAVVNNAAHGAQGGFRGFAQQALHVLHTAGQVGHGIHGLSVGVQTVRNMFQNASPTTQNFARNLMRITVVAGGAAAAMWGVSRAWRAWAGSPTPKTPAMPRMSGGGMMGSGGFTTGLTSMGGPLGNAAFIGTSLFSKMGPMIAAGLAAAGLAGIVGKSMSAGRDDETRRVKFEAIVGDTGKAKTALEELRSFANIAPGQTFSSLVDETKQLVTQGHGVEQITAAFRKVGDVATGTESSVSELAKMWLELKAKGSVSLADLNGMMGKGIPIIDALATTMGKPAGQIAALVQAGKIGMPELEAAWDSLSAAGGRFHGAMDRIGGTTEGAMERIKKEMGGVFSELGKPINDLMSEKLKGNVEWAKSLHEKAKEIGQAFAEAARFIIAAYQEMGSAEGSKLVGGALTAAFQMAVNELHAGLIGAAQAFGSMFGTTIQSLMSIFADMQHREFWAALGNTFLGIANGFRAAMLDGVAAILEGLKRAPGIGRMVGDMPDALRDKASQMRTDAAEEWRDGKAGLKPYIDSYTELLKDSAIRAADAFKAGRGSAKDVFNVDMADLEKLRGNILERMKKNQEATEHHNAPIVKKAPGKGEDEAAPVKARASVGAFAQAVNFIMGRSVHEMILTENQKQTVELQKQTKAAQDAAKDLRDIKARLHADGGAAPKDAVPINPQALFA
jgi:tape measure domain-containing protein